MNLDSKNDWLESLQTKILEKGQLDGYYAYELEDTIFYVEGGGQLPDLGTINGIQVEHVIEKNEKIYHLTKKEVTGQNVDLKVDLKHRYRSAQGHSAQHLLSLAFYELYGYQTISHHYDLEGSAIDLDGKELTEEMCKVAQDYCQKQIQNNLAIKCFYPTKTELEQLPIHKTLPNQKNIRIVEIEGLEYNPCMGMHVDRLGELNMLCVMGYEKIRGVYRVYYKAGITLENYINKSNKVLSECSKLVSKPIYEIANGIQQLKDSQQKKEMEIVGLETKIASMLTQSLIEKSRNHCIFGVFDESMDVLMRMVNQFLEMNSFYGVLIMQNDMRTHVYVFSSKDTEIDCRQLFKKVTEGTNLRGGGQLHLCQGGAKEVLDTEIMKNNLYSFKKI